ncbi:MAG: NAD-dependent epimerase/dehydratase family protein [Moraxellaceae bacterium]|nr:MAG: NAD-dependent epimerase/dehydratase family protein [Moraxellaceae bacterium]
MTTNTQKLLWIGCGDIARQALPLIKHYSITGLSRSYKPYLAAYNFWQADLAERNLAPQLAQQNYCAIVITLSPAGYTADDYRTTYWLNTQYIVQQLPQNSKPLLVFVSSTSVYQQNQGEWVDETSPTEPTSPAAQWLLKAEQEIAQSGYPFCILRPSGIYGPGRDFLIRQVLQGNGGGEQFTNRIHSLDLARLIAFLVERHRIGLALPPYLLASDDAPVTSREIRLWLAQQLSMDPKSLAPSQESVARGGNKRVNNQLLHQLGFEFHYPSYLQGYPELCRSNK